MEILNELKANLLAPNKSYTYIGPDLAEHTMSADEVLAIEMSGRSGTAQNYALAPSANDTPLFAYLHTMLGLMDSRPGTTAPRSEIKPVLRGSTKAKRMLIANHSKLHWIIPSGGRMVSYCAEPYSVGRGYAAASFTRFRDSINACPVCVLAHRTNHA